VKHGGFPAPVWPDQAQPVTLMELKIKFIKGLGASGIGERDIRKIDN
jgi:hypothetical protein